MLGRFRYVGRTSAISYKLLLAFLVNFLIYHYVLCSVKVNHRFDCLEFLLYDERTIQSIEFSVEEKERPGRYRSLVNGIYVRNSRDPLGQPNFNHSKETGVNRCLFAPDPFVLNDSRSANDRWVLRLNRTTRSWRRLSKICLYSLVLMVLLYAFWLWLVVFLMYGKLVTSLGFELAYPNCVHALMAEMRRAETESDNTAYSNQSTFIYAPSYPDFEPEIQPNSYAYSYIYTPPMDSIRLSWLNKSVPRQEFDVDLLPFNMPSKDEHQALPQTIYTYMRILFDFTENYVWYYDFLGYFVGQTFIILCYSVDITTNANEITLRLQKIIKKFRARQATLIINLNQQQLKSSHKPGIKDHIIASMSRNRLIELELLQDMHHIQIILIDHFKLISDYNLYLRFYFRLLFSIALLYSAAFFEWIATIESRTLEVEFITGEVIGLFFLVFLLSGVAISRTGTLRIYKLISSIMAMDNPDSVTKTRWLTILKFYHPKPLYCFTLSGSWEISWMFVLKVSRDR